MNIKEPYKILFLLFVTLGIYYPALFAGYNSVDDWRMVVELENAVPGKLLNFFYPSTGFYYRPLLMLSFVLDKYIWGLEPSFMHLENIFLHACNTILVFIIAKYIFSKILKNKIELPLFAALIFTIHPINTESVNWISGRTDLLGAFFILNSVLFILYGISSCRLLFIIISSLCLMLGVMSKEIMIFFYPVGCGFLYFLPSLISSMQMDRRLRIKYLMFYSLPIFFGVILYMLFRLLFYAGNDNGVHHIYNFFNIFSYEMVGSLFKAFGFYVKKLFIPFPLNFAITEINNNYIYVGMAFFTFSFFLIIFRSLHSIFFLISFYLILPATIIAITRVAWTPLAERYLYLPSLFWSIGIVAIFCNFVNFGNKFKYIVKICFICFLLIFMYATSMRNLIWQDNVKLYKDTVSKNSNFTSINNEYAIALIDEGNLSEAEVQLNIGINNPANVNKLLYVNLARVKIARGDMIGAKNVLLDSFTSKKEANVEVLKILVDVEEKILMNKDFDNDLEELILVEELLCDYNILYRKNYDPIYMYRFGQLALSRGLKAEAQAAFATANKEAPTDAHYKQAAGILAQKLAKE